MIKERLNQPVSDITIFLDVSPPHFEQPWSCRQPPTASPLRQVDDLDDISKLEHYVQSTQVILVFLSAGCACPLPAVRSQAAEMTCVPGPAAAHRPHELQLHA